MSISIKLFHTINFTKKKSQTIINEYILNMARTTRIKPWFRYWDRLHRNNGVVFLITMLMPMAYQLQNKKSQMHVSSGNIIKCKIFNLINFSHMQPISTLHLKKM